MIAVFDSGVGGLTFLYQLYSRCSYSDLLFYADTAHAPYGNQEESVVKKYILNAIHDILQHEVQAIVLACNTATSLMAQELRDIYQIPIIGMEPAVKLAHDNFGNKKILVLATNLTLSGKKYQDLVEGLSIPHKVQGIALPELVEAAENYEFDNPKLLLTIKNKLNDINWSEYGAVVLGCTHFIYFYPLLRVLIPTHVNLVDGNAGTLRQLFRTIPQEQGVKPTLNCYLSGREIDPELIMPYFNYLNKHKIGH